MCVSGWYKQCLYLGPMDPQGQVFLQMHFVHSYILMYLYYTYISASKLVVWQLFPIAYLFWKQAYLLMTSSVVKNF